MTYMSTTLIQYLRRYKSLYGKSWPTGLENVRERNLIFLAVFLLENGSFVFWKTA